MPKVPNDPFTNSALTTILVITDMDLAKEFYVSKLGASVYREYGGDSVVLQFLSHWLLLVKPGGPTPDKPQTYFNPPTDKNQVSHSFTIRVEDCKVSYELLKSRGVSFITPPYTNGPETRCFFRDPDGHLLEISAYQPSA